MTQKIECHNAYSTWLLCYQALAQIILLIYLLHPYVSAMLFSA